MQRIGKYEIIGELGQGGMGAVYKGRDNVIGRDVAIKVIHDRALNAPSIKQRFYREARSAGRLSHENITVIYDVDEENGTPFLVMEYLEGQDLREMLNAGVRFSNEDKLTIAAQICHGLHYAHEQGIVHRDIKPENIRVLPNKRVKIMDFGIARIQNETQALTQTNLSLGTPRYMSPEQIKGVDPDRRGDIFSFGVLFYELLTGANPFMGDHVTTVIYKILHADPQPLDIEPGVLSAELQPIVERCLAKNRDDRYQDFAAVLQDLQPILLLQDQTVALSRGDIATGSLARTVPGRPLPAPSRPGTPRAATATAPEKQTSRKGLWAAAGLVLAIGLLVGGYLVLRPSPDGAAGPSNELAATNAAEEPPVPAATDGVPADTLTDETALPAPDQQATRDAPAAAADPNRQAADQERSAMERARQRIAGRRGEEEVAALYQRAEQTRRTGNQRYDAAAFAEALRAFLDARRQYEDVNRILDQKDQALARAAEPTTQPPQQTDQKPSPARETPPPSTGNQADADRARTAMQTAKTGVPGGLRQNDLYQRALTKEIEGAGAYDARAYDRAAALFTEARGLFADAAAIQTPEAQAAADVQALAQRLKNSIERKDAATMQNTFFRDWSEFFKIASDIAVDVRTSAVQVTGTEARVNVRVDLSYRDNKNQQQQAVTAYTWILEYRENNDTWVLARVPPN